MTERIAIGSEIGRLRRVIVHEPGQEIENVTPATAAEMLYDDILFLQPALTEHRQMTGVLRRVADVCDITDLLADVLVDEDVRRDLTWSVCSIHGAEDWVPELVDLPPDALARRFVEGTLARSSTLALHKSSSRFALPPLPNAFFTRDIASCVGGSAIVGAMASKVRAAESLIVRTLFLHHPKLAGDGILFDGTDAPRGGGPPITIEGGDVLVAREDLLVVGCSERTSVAAIDHLLNSLAVQGVVRDVIVVDVPKTRATIHLDMIFTLVDRDLCVAYPPVLSGRDRCKVYHMALGPEGVVSIRDERNILTALARRGMELTAIPCGGDDPVRQDREQWASGANFLAFAPGKVIGYGRNQATFDALAGHGFEVVTADDVVAGRVDPMAYPRCAVAMSGAETSRGGGGCRCMTLPVVRDAVSSS